MNQPKERPILFKGEMVNAILPGWKTKTRRIMKAQPPHRANLVRISDDMAFFCDGDHPKNHECEEHEYSIKCPYGKPGDRLWVRESFSGPWDRNFIPPSTWEKWDPIWYWADGNPKSGDWSRPKPSIHMPRKFSRILLEITDVRVERLQDISEEDAKAEGVSLDVPIGSIPAYQKSPYVYSFASLWESINGPDSWDANPWVWVVEFKRVEPT